MLSHYPVYQFGSTFGIYHPLCQAISSCKMCNGNLMCVSTLMTCRAARSCPARGHVRGVQPRQFVQEWAPAGSASSGAGEVFDEPAAEAAPAPDAPRGVLQGGQRQPDQPASPAGSLSATLEPFCACDRWHRHHRSATVFLGRLTYPDKAYSLCTGQVHSHKVLHGAQMEC